MYGQTGSDRQIDTRMSEMLLTPHTPIDDAISGGDLVGRAARLAPAAALSPPAPTRFARLSEQLEARVARLDARLRMLVRRIVRFPRRSATTVGGLALSLV